MTDDSFNLKKFQYMINDMLSLYFWKRPSKEKPSDQILPPYISVCLQSSKKNAFGSESQFLRWSTDELNIKELIKLPEQTQQEEWIASQVLSIHNQITTLYDTISSTCTEAYCPVMHGVKNEQYFQDPPNHRRTPSAPEYIKFALDKSLAIIANPNVFPTKHGETFGEEFFDAIQQLLKICFSIMSHIYAKHMPHLIHFGNLHLYLNQLLLHMVLLGEDYQILDPEVRQPLDDLIGYLLPKNCNIKLNTVNYQVDDSPPAFVLPAGSGVKSESVGDFNNNYIEDTPKRKGPSIMDPTFYKPDEELDNDLPTSHSLVASPRASLKKESSKENKVQDTQNSSNENVCNASVKSSSFNKCSSDSSSHQDNCPQPQLASTAL